MIALAHPALFWMLLLGISGLVLLACAWATIRDYGWTAFGVAIGVIAGVVVLMYLFAYAIGGTI